MHTVSDTQQFGVLRQHFLDVCEAAPEVQQAHLAALTRVDPSLAQALAELLAVLDPADLAGDDDSAALQRLTFGPFRVQRRLGSGGMGEVFLATRNDQGFDQQVALKRVHRLAHSIDATRRFLRERQLLARLDHPGIARLVDGGVGDDGRPWLAMEYVDGCSLKAHAQAQALDLRGKVALFRGLCAAVAYAHRHLIVHRDIKPANVLVTADGSTKLLDFGIARLLDDSDSDLTRPGARALTLRYAAPEQIAGDRSTTATDVYALGVLLFELVADGTPYASAAAGGEWGSAVLNEPPRPLLRALEESSRVTLSGGQRREVAELERILRKAMAKLPAERYASVAAFDADLEDWLAQRPLRSGISGTRAQVRHLLRRFRWPLGLAAATLLALAVGLAVAWQQALAAAREAAAAQAHLDAVLEVLAAANPGHFAGTEPTASEFLIAAARQLQQAHADRPALRRRALTEVGHGLLNLGKAKDAEAVLQHALQAAEQDGATSAQRLTILGLLIEAQNDAAGGALLRETAKRIEALVQASPPTTPGAADALTRAAAATARQGDFAAADRLFDLAHARLPTDTDARFLRENFWRQRGWAALRADQAEAATRYLQEADQEIARDRAAFSDLRRAEGDLLQVQAALLRGEATTARARLEQARAAYRAEYPDSHPEAAVFDLLDAQVLLLETRFDAALATVGKVIERLQNATGSYPRDLATAQLVMASALAAQGDCRPAKDALAHGSAAMDALVPSLPRERRRMAVAAERVNEHCGS